MGLEELFEQLNQVNHAAVAFSYYRPNPLSLGKAGF
jgi:hypothetical protein